MAKNGREGAGYEKTFLLLFLSRVLLRAIKHRAGRGELPGRAPTGCPRPSLPLIFPELKSHPGRFFSMWHTHRRGLTA